MQAACGHDAPGRAHNNHSGAQPWSSTKGLVRGHTDDFAPARGSNPRDRMRADVASVLVAKPASGLSPEAPDRAPVGGADVVVVVL